MRWPLYVTALFLLLTAAILLRALLGRRHAAADGDAASTVAEAPLPVVGSGTEARTPAPPSWVPPPVIARPRQSSVEASVPAAPLDEGSGEYQYSDAGVLLGAAAAQLAQTIAQARGLRARLDALELRLRAAGLPPEQVSLLRRATVLGEGTALRQALELSDPRWTERLGEFRTARAALLGGAGSDPAARAAALQGLREQHFREEEREHLQAIEELEQLAQPAPAP